jgi:hypothetical protein
MHAHDRTLLSQLGFADPDKRDRRHDLACQYLALPANRERIVREIMKGEVDPDYRPRFEVPLTKGYDQYKTVIGFVDLIIPFLGTSTYDDGRTGKYRADLVVEVKIGPVGTGDIIRQIRLYREFASESKFLVATAFPISVLGVATLHSSHIHHIRLGEPFERWIESQEEEAPDAANSLTF